MIPVCVEHLIFAKEYRRLSYNENAFWKVVLPTHILPNIIIYILLEYVTYGLLMMGLIYFHQWWKGRDILR